MGRKSALVTGEIYHVFNKSIANFQIFNNEKEFTRMKNIVKYYQFQNRPLCFSQFRHLEMVKEQILNGLVAEVGQRLVQIIAYCIMPTHLHLLVKQVMENGITLFMSKILNSHSRYFNIRHKRKGPLWEGRFANILVKSDEQMLHLTRYIHLNPVTAYLVEKPEDWMASSYQEYVSRVDINDKICRYEDVLTIDSLTYKGFVEDRISYQRELAAIKTLLLGEGNLP